jgi:hypothetical protein
MPAKRRTGDTEDVSTVPSASVEGPAEGNVGRTKEGPCESLEEEIAFYLQHVEGWGEHEGKHVLIQAGKPHGFYLTRDEALREGYQRFGRVSFLVKQVILDERPRPLRAVIG